MLVVEGRPVTTEGSSAQPGLVKAQALDPMSWVFEGPEDARMLGCWSVL